MSTEVITAFIALGGVVVSIIASIFVSLRQATIELRKTRTEFQQTYTDKLLEKRLEVYPALYKLTSDFDKIIRYDTLEKHHIDELFKHILEWDSANAIFMSGRTVFTHVKFLMTLARLVKMPIEDFQKKYADPQERKQLLDQANEVEVALKNDLGVYVIEFPDVDRTFASYYEVNRLLDVSKGK
ncbi:hypothetical protein SE17_06000 [Kouleothrix aurantiaca]|uniref:Uncharacterized protein n=1 Tax=Kouleothrix aurantiaca TaxID=186479 RepID=A0A0P9DKM6_9CHLR|nr:hypothetical protein SE17_06000 [Kouleothrix aurantiaca]